MSYLHSGSLPLTEIQVSLNSPLPSFNKVRVTKHQPLSINKHSLNQVTGLTSGMNTEVESGTVLASVVEPLPYGAASNTLPFMNWQTKLRFKKKPLSGTLEKLLKKLKTLSSAFTSSPFCLGEPIKCDDATVTLKDS
ncbi:hypothetical protein MG293_003940 [Ovis ammon polii]|uniref:Uncharacterized protein n=1 Tax=Ovis ammon polii TaxID=230172 RepID=A0AAD4UPD2_OVIAM|nr:hypothetical protein MG293_003940 [Ovis ammon polii]